MKTRIYYTRKHNDGNITIYGNRGRTNYSGYTLEEAQADYMIKTSRNPWAHN